MNILICVYVNYLYLIDHMLYTFIFLFFRKVIFSLHVLCTFTLIGSICNIILSRTVRLLFVVIIRIRFGLWTLSFLYDLLSQKINFGWRSFDLRMAVVAGCSTPFFLQFKLWISRFYDRIRLKSAIFWYLSHLFF